MTKQGETKPHFVRLLGRFGLHADGRSVRVGRGAQRLFALLAVKGPPLPRRQVAGLLWADVPAGRADANLRSALWRLSRTSPNIVSSSFHELRLSPGTRVDLVEVAQMARRLVDRSELLTPAELRAAVATNLYEDLLPDLPEEPWLAAEREQHRQLRLHALEALSERLLEAGRGGTALDVALAAVRADPFRESAYQMSIKVFLAEGDPRTQVSPGWSGIR